METFETSESLQVESQGNAGFSVRHSHTATLPVRRRKKGPHVRPSDVRPSHPTVVRHPIQPSEPAVIRPEGNRSTGYLATKRIIDIVGALVALVLFSPFMLFALVVLVVTTRGKPFFSQERLGECGRKFRMHKFRTMRLDAEQLQHLVKNEKDGPIFKNRRDPRVTRFGRFLRSFSIDEMPQLWNVLKGEMSLVGPRPLPTHEANKCRDEQRRRFGVKPGLTCLWQISGRSEVGFEEWIRMDLWYLKHQGLWTDLTLLVKTPLSVLSRRGAY